MTGELLGLLQTCIETEGLSLRQTDSDTIFLVKNESSDKRSSPIPLKRNVLTDDIELYPYNGVLGLVPVLHVMYSSPFIRLKEGFLEFRYEAKFICPINPSPQDLEKKIFGDTINAPRPTEMESPSRREISLPIIKINHEERCIVSSSETRSTVVTYIWDDKQKKPKLESAPRELPKYFPRNASLQDFLHFMWELNI